MTTDENPHHSELDGPQRDGVETAPTQLLIADRQRALAASDPCANLLYLATVDGDGAQVRTLLVRDIVAHAPAPQPGDGGAISSICIIVQISTTSPKWRQLQENSSYELLVHYPTIPVQYRLRGSYELRPNEESLAQWNAKRSDARALDTLYEQVPQSAPLPRDYDLARESSRARQLVEGNDGVGSLAMPEHIVGVGFVPQSLERWSVEEARRDAVQGQSVGVTRERFDWVAQRWVRTRLMP